MKLENIVNLFLISCNILFSAITMSLISPFYPSVALEKGVTVTQSGLVMATVFVTNIIVTPLCGKYIKVLGARSFFIVGFFIVGFGNFCFAFLIHLEDTNTFFGLSILLKFLTALGQAASTPAAYTLAAKQVLEKNRGKAMSALEACFGIGTIVGPTVGGGLYDIGGFSLPFWVSGSTIVFMALMTLLFFKDSKDFETNSDEDKTVKWLSILKLPGVIISFLSVLFAGIAWNWFSASLEPFMKETFSSSASEVGLVFLTLGLTYTVFTPVFGFLTDRGLDGLLTCILGNSLIAVSFILLGPIPPLSFLESSTWMMFVSLGITGVGSAATYIGTLLYMLRSARESGLPGTEQTSGMVSSVWVVAGCVGGTTGSTMGGVAYDTIGFEWGSMVMFLSLSTTVMILIIYLARVKLSDGRKQGEKGETEGD